MILLAHACALAPAMSLAARLSKISEAGPWPKVERTTCALLT